MEFIIRKMKEEDIPQVQQVARASWNSTYEGIIPPAIQESFLKAAYNGEMMQKRLERTLMLVAESGTRIAGFANYSPVKDGEAELAAIYLLPDYQGNGIGTALLHEGIRHLAGVREIYINVEKDNEIGFNFYKAKGFRTVNEFDDDFEGHTLKTVRMALKV